MDTVDYPIACAMGAMDAAQRERYQSLRALLHGYPGEVREMQDGYAFVYPGDPALYVQLAEWATLERLCCPFLTFGLELAGEGGPITLRLTGRAGVKAFLREELGLDACP